MTPPQPLLLLRAGSPIEVISRNADKHVLPGIGEVGVSIGEDTVDFLNRKSIGRLRKFSEFLGKSTQPGASDKTTKRCETYI